MTISARLEPKTQLALTRYCKARGITRAQAIERGIQLLLQEETMEHHPAYTAYLRVKGQLNSEPPAERQEPSSSSTGMKEHLDAKYPA